MASGDFGEPRLIHSSGCVQLCTDKSGDSSEWAFLSSGSDGDVWFWGKEELDEADYAPKSICSRTFSTIAWHGLDVFVGHIYTDPRTGIEKPVVSKMDIENFEVSLPIASFSLDVTSVDVSKSGTRLAVGAIDHMVKVINLSDQEFVRMECEGQILCVSFDPMEEFLAVSASDGKLYIFELLPECKTTPVFTSRLCSRITDIDPSQTRLQLCWSLDGEHLFASALGGVKKFKRNFMQDSSILIADETLIEVFSVCCMSPCDRFIAGSTLSGFICVWQVNDGSLISFSKYIRNGEPRVICSMVWHGSLDNTIVFADIDEHLCSLYNCVREAEVSKTKKRVIIEDDDENDTRLSADVGAIKKAYGFNEDGEIVDDFVPSRFGGENLYSEKVVEKVQPYKPPTLPKAFISGSTPEHLAERYLKWNRFGMITSYATSTENSIEVTWHDTSVHSSMNIDNSTTNYTVGDISNEAFALGSKEDGDVQSGLYVCYIAAWDQSSREWKASMSSGESIEDIAIGGEFIAIFTSSRCFRTFSLAGTQRIIISYSGVLSTVCASHDRLALATYSGGYFFEEGIDNPQYNVAVQIYKTDLRNWYRTNTLVETVLVALGRNSKLMWMGYSREGELCILDSKSCLRILTKNGAWIPIYDFSGVLKSSSDTIWPISVVEKPEPEIRYLYCKGAAHPLVACHPTPIMTRWQINLCNEDSEKSRLEGSLLLTEIRRSFIECGNRKHSPELQELLAAYAKDVVLLFALSCKAERECRAAEMAWLAPNSQVLQSLCNFAAKTRHPLLSEKVAGVGRQYTENQLDEANNETDENKLTLPSRRSVNISRRSDRAPEVKLFRTDESQFLVTNVGEDPEMTDTVPLTQTPSSSLERTLASELSSRTPLGKLKSASNPFKRKSVDTIGSENGNLFDALATPEYRSLAFSSLKQAKKVKQNEDTSKQSRLSFSAQTLESKGTTGFELWLNSVESNLRDEFEGEESDFTKFATKKFRNLNQEEKKKWNSTAQSSIL